MSEPVPSFPPAEEGATAPEPRRRRSGWQRLRLWLAGLVLVGALVTVAWLAVTGRSIAFPSWVAERVEARLNRALGGEFLNIGGIQVVVARNGLPRVSLGNVTVFDGQRQPLARVAELRARLDRAALLRGRIEPRELILSGAEMTIRRRADGTFDLALGGGMAATGTMSGVLDAIEAIFAAAPLSAIERIEAGDVTLSVEDAHSGRVWQVTGGRISLDQDETQLDLTVAAEIFNGTEELASAVIGFRTTKGSPAARLVASFDNAAAADIAAQSPVLAFLGVLDAPISGALNTVIDDTGALSSLAGTLEIAAGSLRPEGSAPPMTFDGARVYFDYDPERQRIGFSQLAIDTEAARLEARGHAYLRDFRDGWPTALVGQIATSEFVLAPEGVFAAPVAFDRAAADFRLRFAPFSVELGQLALIDGPRRYLTEGVIAADAKGWRVSLDLGLNQIEPARLLDIWPLDLSSKARTWLQNNVRAALVHDVQGAVRVLPGEAPRVSVSYRFRDAEVRILPRMPPVTGAGGYASFLNDVYTMAVEVGEMASPAGGSIDVAGSVFQIPDTAMQPTPGRVSLAVDGGIEPLLALLDRPPLELMKKVERSPDIASGHVRANATLAFDLGREIGPGDVVYKVDGVLTDVVSETLVPGRRFTAERLELRADNDGLEIAGPARLDKAAFTGVWQQLFDAEHRDRSSVEGTARIDPDFLDSFGIRLPAGSVAGQGAGRFTLDLVKDAAPVFTLISDLNRLRLRLDALGWSKPANATGRLEIAGRLGERARVDRLILRAPGLSAEGTVTMRPGGGLDAARFSRLRVGDWLDAAVTLTGRGNAAPLVSFEGGTLDTRRAALGGGGGGSGGGAAGGGAPIQASLDRVIMSQGIALTDFVGSFTTTRGLDGRFAARVNGRTPIEGRIVPQRTGSALQVKSDDAGRVLADAGILRNARGGQLELVLRPTGADGVYDGSLTANGTRMVGAPTLTALLNAVSVVGLVDQLNGEGLHFDDVQAVFRLTPTELRLFRSSAVGPSVGISLDGTYSLATGRLNLQGVLSPFYFLNGLGQLFTRRGEGLFGVTFTIRGSAEEPRLRVNPLSILTPGTFREIFRREPPRRRSVAPSQ